MNGADWIIIAVLGISVLVGVWRGLLREALSLGVWLAAITAAMLFGSQVAQLFGNWIDLPSARIALGHVTVFLLVLVLGGLLTWTVGRIVAGSGLSGTDRVLGLGFGLLRGGLLVAVLVLVLGYTPFAQDPWWQQSHLIPRFEPAADWLREWIPDTLAGLQGLAPVDRIDTGDVPVPASN